MLPASCSLNEDGLGKQLERYRVAGNGARVIEQHGRRLVIRVSDESPAAVIEELVGIERGCCPFFELDWNAGERRLAVAIAREEHEPALAAIAFALGLESSSRVEIQR